MCGIAGVISDKIPVEERNQLVGRMIKIMNHRGPDGQGFYHDSFVSFGHNRLSIIDLEMGAQPMFSDDGRFLIIYNGEIYNYIEIRQDLIKQGIKFKTNSDTEVLLRLLIRYGVEAIPMLNGMFAFCFYDITENSFVLCRDHLGIKPVYFAQTDRGLFFASEIKALVKSGAVKAQLNQNALLEYFTFQFCLGQKTLFDNVLKLEPGTYVRGIKNTVLKAVRYWDTNFTTDSDHDTSYFESQLASKLQKATKLQMRSDVPVGTYLSGGIDSSVVTLLAQQLSTSPLPSFHGKFSDYPKFDESQYAQVIVDKTGGKLWESMPTHKDFISDFQKLIYFLDEPVGGPGSFPQFLVSKLASKHVKVILGGQGGDELFCGYARYLIGYLEQAIKGAIFETHNEGKHIIALNSVIKSLPILKEYVPLLTAFWKDGLFDEMDSRYFKLIDRSPDINTFLHPEFKIEESRKDIFNQFQNLFHHPQTKSYINKMTHFDLKTLLPALLQIEDRVSMASSLESRVPLLDIGVVDLVTSMPPSVKFNEGQTKYILKSSMQSILPPEILERKDKMGFPVPISEWLKIPAMREFIVDGILNKQCKERGILNADAISKLISQEIPFSRQLWGIISLEVWFKTFIDSPGYELG
jgi:asparagine synthase (glutamine-hydrolysing)